MSSISHPSGLVLNFCDPKFDIKPRLLFKYTQCTSQTLKY